MKHVNKNSIVSAIAALILAVSLAGCGAIGEEIPKARLAKAEAMFVERCKKSGEFIHRTVENVEGVFLLKVRSTRLNYGNSPQDQFALDDPYGSDSMGENYIKTFFADFHPVPHRPPPGWTQRGGYAYVDAVDPEDGKRYRYTGRIREYEASTSPLYGDVKKFKTTGFVLDKSPTLEPSPRYGVTYDDISTREEREYWIAGSSLKVIDLDTNEVIAERVGYMMDRGQGNNSGGRAPWLVAARWACPSFPADPGGHPIQANQAQSFVVKTLRPRPEK